MAKIRDASREAFWRRALERRAESGMTIVDFCASERLTVSAYHYWRREIERRDAESAATNLPSASEPALAAVELVEDDFGSAAIEIVAENGFVIRVGRAATTDHMRRVLLAVRELD